MKKASTLMVMAATLAMTLLAACDEVDVDERLVYRKPVAVSRNVLIEDFTGQRCVNCPNAIDEIKRLQDTYGADTVIAVGIHSGPFAKNSRGVPYALYTEEGDVYYDFWHVESQPKGVVDRKGTSEYTSWSAIVREELLQTAPVDLHAVARFDSDSRQVTVDVDAKGSDGDTHGYMQVWLVEDGVTDFQYMPDGSVQRDFTHQHVFRRSANGTWGTPFTIREGDERGFSYICEVDGQWDAGHMSAVAFVYNDSGVAQVVITKFQTKQQ